MLVPWGRFLLCHSPGSDLNLDCGLRDHVDHDVRIMFGSGYELFRLGFLDQF